MSKLKYKIGHAFSGALVGYLSPLTITKLFHPAIEEPHLLFAFIGLIVGILISFIARRWLVRILIYPVAGTLVLPIVAYSFLPTRWVSENFSILIAFGAVIGEILGVLVTRSAKYSI